MGFKDLIKIALFGCLVYVGVIFVMPFWHKYSLSIDLGQAAQFGVVQDATVESVRSNLAKKLDENGWKQFKADDFSIQRDESGNTTISIEYEEAVKLFGKELTKFKFSVNGSSAKK